MTDTIRQAFDAQNQLKLYIDRLTQHPLDAVLQAISTEFRERTRTISRNCDEENFPGFAAHNQCQLDIRHKELKAKVIRCHKEAITKAYLNRNQIHSIMDALKSYGRILTLDHPLTRRPHPLTNLLQPPTLLTYNHSHTSYPTPPQASTNSYVPQNMDNEKHTILYGSRDEIDSPETDTPEIPQIFTKEMTHIIVPKGAKEALETQDLTKDEVEWGLVILHFARSKDTEYRGIHSKFMDSLGTLG